MLMSHVLNSYYYTFRIPRPAIRYHLINKIDSGTYLKCITHHRLITTSPPPPPPPLHSLTYKILLSHRRHRYCIKSYNYLCCRVTRDHYYSIIPYSSEECSIASEHLIPYLACSTSPPPNIITTIN